MKSDIFNMNKDIKKLERIVDRQERYSHHNSLLLPGITEGEREYTDDLVLETLSEKMHVDLTPSNLDRTHSVGLKKASSNKSRTAIIKFVSYNTRKIFF